MNKILYIITITFVCSSIILGVSLKSSIDKNEIFIGDNVTYTVEITAEKGYEIYMPRPGAELGQFEIINFKSEDEEIDTKKIKKKYIYKLGAFIVGDFYIPSLPIKYKSPDGKEGMLKTQRLDIKVKSVSSDSQVLNDIKPVITFKRKINYLLYSIIGLLIVIIIVLIIYFKKRRVVSEDEEFDESIDPYDEAIDRLNKLKELNLIEEGKIKLYYIILTDIFKRFIHRTYKNNFLEMTTYEIEQYFESGNLEQIGDYKKKVVDVLKDSDMVKFAKFIPTEEKSYDIFDNIKELIDGIKNISKLEFNYKEETTDVDDDMD